MRLVVTATDTVDLLGPDGSSGPTPTARQAVSFVADAWTAARPAQVDAAVMDGGGVGFLDALADAAPEIVAAVVRGPFGDDVPVVIRLSAPGSAGARTAYVSAAQAAGQHLAATHAAPEDVWRASSYGVGQMVTLAAGLATRVVVSTGGLVTYDAGAGMISALAGGAPEGAGPSALDGGAASLGAVTVTDLDRWMLARRALSGIEIVGATDDDLPLLGLHGTSATHPAAHGEQAHLAQQLERDMGQLAHQVAAVVVDQGSRSLLVAGSGSTPAQTARTLSSLPGAGSGGGLGFALATLGGRLLPGAQVVADAVGLGERLGAADLAVVVLDQLDALTMHGGLLSEVVRRASAYGVPVIVMARSAQAGRREWSAAGVSGVYELGDDGDLAGERVARVARTWTPQAPPPVP